MVARDGHLVMIDFELARCNDGRLAEKIAVVRRAVIKENVAAIYAGIVARRQLE